MATRAAEAKAANHITKALITLLVERDGDPEVRKGRSARFNLPILIHGKGGNIQTNLKEFTEQLAFVAGVEFGDAFNCVRLGEYFTYESGPYRDTVAHYEHQLAELGEKIADAASANEKKTLRDRKALLTARHEAKSDAAINAEDMGRLEDYKLEARMRHQRREDLVNDKKKPFFSI